MRLSSLLIFLLVAWLLPQVGLAQSIRQRSSAEGLSVSLQAHMLGWSSDYFQYLDENSGNGLGLGARVGYGLTQRYEVFAQYEGTRMALKNVDAESFRFAHLTGGLRLHFSATSRALRPFAELGYVHRTSQINDVINGNRYQNVSFKGGALHVGGGLQYFVSLPVAIILSGSVQAGGKAPVRINGEDSGDRADLSTYKVSLGITVNISEL